MLFLQFPWSAFADELAFVDIHYGNEYLGSSLASFNDSQIHFESPGEFISLLPPTSLGQKIEGYFSEAIDYFSSSDCTVQRIQSCFDQTDGDVIVVFEPQEFVVRVFIRPSQLVVQAIQKERYLHPYRGDMTYSGNLYGVLATSASEITPTTENYNLELRQMWSLGHQRFNANLGRQSQQDHVYVRDLSFIHEESGDRLILGRHELRGNRLTPNTTVTGFSVGTTTDLRLDLDQSGASPINLFLSEESRVELRRDGQLVSARNYSAGNRQLDVSDLPEGAYDLNIRVLVNGKVVDEIQRYFIKSTDIPARGEYQAAMEAGVISDFYDPRLLENGEFLRLRLGNRILDSFFVNTHLIYTHDWLALQPNATIWLPGVIAELALMTSNDGYRAGDVSLLYQHSTLGSFNLGWFKASVPESAGVLETPSNQLRRSVISTETANFSYRLGGHRWAFRTALYYKKEAGEEFLSSLGAVDFSPFERLPNLRFSLQLRDERQGDFSAGLEINYLFPTRNKQQLYVRSREKLTGTFQRERSLGVSGELGGNDYQWRYGLSVNDQQDNTVLRSYNQYNNPYLRSSLDLSAQTDQARARSAVASFQTNFTSTGGNHQFYQGGGYRSGIIVSLPSDLVEPVDLFINDTRRIRVFTGTKTFIPLSAYEMYSVRLEPTSGLPINYDLSSREVTLYPGTVPVLTWKGKRIFPAFGQLSVLGLPLGEPIRLQTGTSQDRIENGGFFVLDIEEDKPYLEVRQNGNTLCRVKVLLDTQREVQDLGDLSCSGDSL